MAAEAKTEDEVEADRHIEAGAGKREGGEITPHGEIPEEKFLLAMTHTAEMAIGTIILNFEKYVTVVTP